MGMNAMDPEKQRESMPPVRVRSGKRHAAYWLVPPARMRLYCRINELPPSLSSLIDEPSVIACGVAVDFDVALQQLCLLIDVDGEEAVDQGSRW